MANTDFKSVDGYLAKQPKAVRAVLARVRAVVQKAVPGLEEGISYQIPVYKLEGELVIFVAGWKAHYSLYPATDVAAAFAKELIPYEVSKGTIRFSLNEPIPVKLIDRIVKFRAQLATERAKRKAERKRPKAKTAAKKASKRTAPKRTAPKRTAPKRAAR